MSNYKEMKTREIFPIPFHLNPPKIAPKSSKFEEFPSSTSQEYVDRFYHKYNHITNNLLQRYIIITPTEERNNNSSSINPNLVAVNLQGARDLGITGKDVVVAIVDSGIINYHPDIEKDRIIFYKDFSNESNQDNPKDILGHGTHVASIIGGTGKASNGYNQGIAPDVKFVVLRITSVSEIIKALEWLKQNGKKYNIKVINLSIGVDPTTSWTQDTIAKLANDLAQNFTVVAAAGNDQTYETIDSPGVAPDVITVGGSDSKNTPQIDDDTIYIGSSKGPTPYDKLDKPDVIAPAKKVVGVRVPNSIFDPYNQKGSSSKDNQQDNLSNSNPPNPWEKGYYIESSGTSAATAMVSGLAALLYQILPDASPQTIKKIITSTAVKLKDTNGQEFDKYSQGNGLIDITAAVKMALQIKESQKQSLTA